MATDVARQSFDPARRYTGVTHQQGRVTLEAEENEELAILAEASRHELLDIVGKVGTPDDGYRISKAGINDFTIGAGTMYVGGVRVSLAEDILYSAQPDWLDRATDQEFLAPGPAPGKIEGYKEHVVLVLTEYDVTATEDPVLREVALGGPDGAARVRIIQRVRRLPTGASDCTGALEGDVAAWAKQGLELDPDTLELRPASRLLVEWETPDEPPDPCEPASTGGYLGAENQVIRIQISSVDPDSGNFDLVWGWDNASFLYRVTADDSEAPALTLDRQPVDHHHRPRAGQAVELLPAAAALHGGDGVVEGWVAEQRGQVKVLLTPYNPDDQSVAFPSSPPSQWTDPDTTPQLYLRVWEELLTDCKLGEDIVLGTIGVRVRLSTNSGLALHAGDHWSIAVRPATPTTVLPARLLRTPQPPDGPRMWVCPLAVLAWSDAEPTVLEDCRVPFDQLTEIEQGCCTIRIGPDDASGKQLQHAIDRAATERPSHNRAHRVTVCLAPGRYELDAPLVLGEQHGHMHLEGCGEGVVLSAAPGNDRVFAQGLIVLLHADNVRISGIEFELPLARARDVGVKPVKEELKLFPGLVKLYETLYVSVGVRPLHCAELKIDHCLFRFRIGPPTAGAEPPRQVFAAGIFAGSECWGLSVERNRFLHDVDYVRRGGRDRNQLILLAGLLLAPSLVLRSDTGQEDPSGLPDGTLVHSLLSDASLRDNHFAGLSVGVAVFADLGDIRVQDNAAIGCYGGVWLSSLEAQAFIDFAARYEVGDVSKKQLDQLGEVVLGATVDPVLLALSVIARTYPLPAAFKATGLERAHAKRDAADAQQHDGQQWMQAFIAEAFEPFESKSAAGDLRVHKLDIGFDLPKATVVGAISKDVQEAMQTAVLKLSAAERAIAVAPRHNRMRLHCTGNDLDCDEADDRATGPALLLWGAGLTEEVGLGSVSAVIADNRMTATSNGPVATVIRVPQAVATGNLLHNRSDDRGMSIALLCPASGIAVTGNVLRGQTLLPPRPLPAPLDTWDALNTVTL
jgi:hypothetical protein